MLNVAIVGATGAVGRAMIEELARLPLDFKIGLFASARSAGTRLGFRDEDVEVKAFRTPNDLKGYDFVLMSAGGDFSRSHAREISEMGCVVIDNSSAWRMTDDVPLIVPEVNIDVCKNGQSRLIANPNCSTIQLVVALKPLMDRFGLNRVDVTTYQSVSGSGQAGIDELQQQLNANALARPIEAKKYQRRIFNNLIPAIDVFRDGGHCFEEEKMVRETRKIMRLQTLDMTATTVRVPVMNCHSEAVTVELNTEVSRAQVFAAYRAAEGIRLFEGDNYADLPCPETMRGQPDVAVSRVRLPLGRTNSKVVQFWNVADNLRKGAATNAVQILHALVRIA